MTVVCLLIADDRSDTHIVLSTLHESHILRIDGRDTLTRLEPGSSALVTNQPTLALSNIARRVQRTGPTGTVSAYTDSAYVVQITPKSINLFEYDNTLQTFNRVGTEWVPEQGGGRRPPEIVAASVNASQFVVALSGGTVVLLNLGFDGQWNVVKYVIVRLPSSLFRMDSLRIVNTDHATSPDQRYQHCLVLLLTPPSITRRISQSRSGTPTPFNY